MPRLLRSDLFVCFVVSCVVAIGSGTPYVYSSYAPQLLAQCGLPISAASRFALSLSTGNSLLGFFAGIVVDKNPQLGCLIGAVFTFTGYVILHICYQNALDSVGLISLALIMVGFGSINAYSAAIKVSTANFPNRRGTAVAVPVSLYALASVMFSLIHSYFFDEDTGSFLVFLALFCSILMASGYSYVKIIIPQNAVMTDTENLDEETTEQETENNTSEKNASSYQELLNTLGLGENVIRSIKSPTFIAYAVILATLQGIGQTYIYSVGFILDTQLNSVPQDSLPLPSEKIQALEVAVISVFSFFGRISSGPISDVLVRKFHSQRLWIVALSGLLMLYASLKMIAGRGLPEVAPTHFEIANAINSISMACCSYGYAYGMLFGTFPALVADTFGTDGFSTIWGIITTGGVFAVQYFSSTLSNELYANTSKTEIHCSKGAYCYINTFRMLQLFSFLAVVLTSFLIYNRNKKTYKMFL